MNNCVAAGAEPTLFDSHGSEYSMLLNTLNDRVAYFTRRPMEEFRVARVKVVWGLAEPTELTSLPDSRSLVSTEKNSVAENSRFSSHPTTSNSFLH